MTTPVPLRVRAIAVLALVMLCGHAGSVRADDDSGVPLLPWAKKLAPHRYESPRDWDGTVKFFRDEYKGQKTVRFGRENSVPAAKYIHIDNLATAGKWDGINIYELPDGRVRFFVLERAKKAASAPPPKSGEPKSPAPTAAGPKAAAPTAAARTDG